MPRAGAAAVIVIVVALMAGGTASTSASAVPRTLASYCSPSGDVCFRAVVMNGTVRLGIATAARYFARYTLCFDYRVVPQPGSGAVRFRFSVAARCGTGL
ncbi:MAG: hypothetical protein WKF41_15015 [Gaiellaceae bacterium]